jgi:hypothetical protein
MSMRGKTLALKPEARILAAAEFGPWPSRNVEVGCRQMPCAPARLLDVARTNALATGVANDGVPSHVSGQVGVRWRLSGRAGGSRYPSNSLPRWAA